MDFVLTSVAREARRDILLVIRYIQLVVRLVQSVGAKGHRQLVVKVKVRVKRVVKQVEVERGDPAISKLIK